MKEVCLILLIIACASAFSTVDLDWEAFKIKFNRQYSADEDVQRQKIFNANKLMIEEHNKKFEENKVSFKMGINKFADKFPEEMSLLRGYKGNKNTVGKPSQYVPKNVADLPDTVDWREKGYVTPVKDQGDYCGSGWAFSATGALEGQNFAKTGTLISLSEQNLVDCLILDGCFGGVMNDAFRYVRRNNGIDSEESYPYSGLLSVTCYYDPKNIGGTCSDFKVIKSGCEHDLMSATALIGPISVAIDASAPSFTYYTGGVYYEQTCSSNYVNHGALVVGYGNYEGQDYWLVKNSWGTDWGLEGYIMMSRNRRNNCGIASRASYPIV